MQQLQDLNKSMPKDKADEGLLESLAKLDAESTIAKDDLVSPICSFCQTSVLISSGRYSTSPRRSPCRASSGRL